jgi:glycosyltransferase involved in cell wall biosynthesis
MKFSVSLSVYKNDTPKIFKKAFASIVQQTLEPSEVVLVVDGPITILLEKVVFELEQNCNCLKVIRLLENSGHGVARQIGIENCSFDIVALMDSDDISVPDRFEKQIEKFINDPTLSIVGGYIDEFVNGSGELIGKRVVPSQNNQIRNLIKSKCPMNQVTVMFRKTEVIKAGGYLDWYCNEDYYLWIRMYIKGAKFENIPEVLVNVRVDKDTYKRRGGWKYFISEAKLQSYMLARKIISLPRFIFNVLIRFLLQVIFTDSMRSLFFKKFARKGLQSV